MLVLVDTSVWINLLSKRPKFRISQHQLEVVATCLPVIQEVCQGISDEGIREKLKDRFLSLNRLGDPVDLDYFLSAAEIYSTGRRKGLTIRSSVDCLIAAIALKHNATVWHLDQDFDTIAKFTALKEMTAGPK